MKQRPHTNGRTHAQTAEAPRSGAASATVDGFSRDQLLHIYRTMLLSRRIDDKEIQLKNQSLIFFQISGAGHEAIMVAAGLVLKAGYDWFFPYYRDRALCLELGMTPLEMFLSAVGAKDDPNSGGRQMPSHWGHKALNIVSQSSPTGTQCLHAVGCAEAGLLYGKLKGIASPESKFKNDEVVYCSIGDGTTSEGEFWESLSTACVRQLPVVFVVEDNGYAISVPVEVQTPGGSISDVVRSFPGLKVLRCDGTDVFESYRAMSEAVTYCRERKGPALVHAKVTRPYSHSLSDDERLYKTAAERAEEARRDPITKLGTLIKERGFATDEDLAAIAKDVDREVTEAADAAVKAEKPAKNTAGLWLYSPDVDPASSAFESTPAPEGKPDTMVSAINRTMKDEMAANPRIVMFGEDVADATHEQNLKEVQGKGGVFKVTHGLQKAFGSDRVFNSPLAEANIVGRALGMAVRGLKPVVEIQFFDYIWPAMMQLRDEVSMLRYRSSNQFSCPMVIRTAIGGYLRGGAPYHSQSGESIFAHCPGIRGGLSVKRAGRRGSAAHGYPLRRSGALPRAQASVSPDLQQGRVPGRELHDSVRQGGREARRHRFRRRHLGGAGAAHAARRAAGGKGRDQYEGHRPPHDHAVRLGCDRGRGQGHQPHRHRARGSADLRFRRRTGRARCQRSVRVS